MTHPEPRADARSKLNRRENRRADPISRFLAAGSFSDRSPMTCQLTFSLSLSLSSFLPLHRPLALVIPLARLSLPRARYRRGGKGDGRGTTLLRTVLSEGFKGRDENSGSFATGCGQERGRGRLQSIFIIYLGVFVGLASA